MHLNVRYRMQIANIWKVEMNDGDRDETSLTHHHGLFLFTGMLFGFKNASGIDNQWFLLAKVKKQFACIFGQYRHMFAYCRPLYHPSSKSVDFSPQHSRNNEPEEIQIFYKWHPWPHSCHLYWDASNFWHEQLTPWADSRIQKSWRSFIFFWAYVTSFAVSRHISSSWPHHWIMRFINVHCTPLEDQQTMNLPPWRRKRWKLCKPRCWHIHFSRVSIT